MISVAAIRMQQFGVQFYQASLTANDIDKLVRFEVLSYGEQAQPVRGGRKKAPAPAEQGELGPARAADRREREGLSAPDHPQEDRRARAVLRAMPPGARSAIDSWRRDHLVRRGAQVRARRSRVDGRHAEGARSGKGSCARSTGSTGCSRFTRTSSTSATSRSRVPAVIFDRLPEDHVVQMFVTINAKHTRLNASHLVSLSGPPALSRTRASPRRTTSSAR